MEKLREVGLLCSGIRGLMYLEAFVRNETVPGIVICHGKTPPDMYSKYPADFWKRHEKYFDIGKDISYYASKLSVEIVRIYDSDINSDELTRALAERPEKYFIFSGGGIIGKDTFGKSREFIHIHPGMLPDYRGSTCYYYSLLKEDRCVATAFFMQSRLDTGDIIMRKEFEVPYIDEADWVFFDLIFDPWMRAELLHDVIDSYKRKRSFDSHPQGTEKGDTYFVIHPVLKHLAIKKRVRLK